MNTSVSLRIYCDRRSGLAALLTTVLLAATMSGYLAWGRTDAAASGIQVPLATTSGMRQYYLTDNPDYDGSQASTACESGYHMASLWEILDTSKMKYNTGLGASTFDSGYGPPTEYTGWVRTGYASNSGTVTGNANCNAWTSASASHRGTFARLPSDWAGRNEGLHVWDVEPSLCSIQDRVWCVEDSGGIPVYLPIIMKSLLSGN